MLGESRLGLPMLALGLCDQASYASRVSYLTKCRNLACQRLEAAPAFCLDTVQASAIRGVRNRRCDFKHIDRESRIGVGMNASTYGGDGDISARKRDIRHLADARAPERRKWLARAAFFHEEDLRYLKFLIPEGARVLELGCGTGDLLAALKPSFGVGVDFSPGMIAQARQAHPDLTFLVGDIERLEAAPAFCLDTVQASAIRGVRNRRCDFKHIDRESRV
jgi:SAM-dependent methyltransferase